VVFSLRVPSGAGDWHVREVDISEELSGEYVAIVDVESDDPLADPHDLLGRAALLLMQRDSVDAPPRTWAGVVRAVEEPWSGEAFDRRLARLTVEPAFACLKEEVTTRKFQEMTIPAVVREVLAQVHTDLGRDVRSLLVREQEKPDSSIAYAVRDLCVQYGERTFDFIRRVLAEEGIAYFFESDDERESLVLIDDGTAFPLLGKPVRYLPLAGMARSEESVSSFLVRRGRAPRKAVLRGFDPTRHLALDGRLERLAEQGGAGTGDGTTYDPGTAVTLFGAKGDDYSQSDIEWQARLRLERELTKSAEGRGSGDVLAFRPGLVFELDPGGLASMRREKFLITAVRHRGRNPDRRAGDRPSGEGTPDYANEFTCLPAGLPFRPAPLPKPRAVEDWGIVVSPSDGDPIFTDRHGRVRVRFGYDREEGVRADLCSTWLPVAQAWAGSGYGVQIIPRAGMLVRLRYLFGDPDRPFVAGCLPTARNTLPSPLPEEKSRLTIRTRSLRNGGNDLEHYNEISLEDAAQREEVFIRAGHDYRREVLNDERVEVGGDEHRTIAQKQTIEVGGDRKLTVKESEQIRIKQGRSVEVVGDEERHVHGKDTTTVAREMRVEVRGPRTTTVKGLDKGTFQDGRHHEVKGNDDLHVTETLTTVADVEFRAEQGASFFSLKDGDAHVRASGSLTLEVDGGTLHMKPDGEAVLQCNTKVELSCGEASIVLTPDKVEIAAPEVQLTGANGSVKLDRSGATTTGLNVTSSALGKNELTGAFVKAN
jgi:type VI secretion system secreted protein VgrG